VAVAPDGGRLATAQASGTFRVWDLATGVRLHTLDPDGGLPPYVVSAADVAFSPDGRWLAGTYNIWSECRRSWRGTVAVWQAGTGGAATLMRLGVEAGPCLWTPTGDGLRVHGTRHVFAFTFATARPAN
jgi:WD40 repeat protein